MRALIVLFVVPILWSAAVHALRGLLGCSKRCLDDTGEKAVLVTVITPVVLGAALFTFWRVAPLHWTLPTFPALPAPAEAPATPFAGAPATAQPNLLAFVFPVLWALYGTGLLWKSGTLCVAILRLRRIVNTATPAQVAGMRVQLTGATISPLAIGRDTIILPTTLATKLSIGDLQLLLAHERAHLDRRDPLYFALLSCIDAIFWFNPFVLAQTRHCRTAAEIACDRAAISPGSNEAYARLLIGTLRGLNTAVDDTHHFAPAVFAPEHISGYRQRLEAILESTPARPRRLLYAALGGAALPLVFAQVAYSQAFPQQPANAAPVALSDGTVTRIDHHPASDHQCYGEHGAEDCAFVQIDHGGGVIGTYTIVGGQVPKLGDKVSAGQQLAKSGGSGSVSVQMKLSKDGQQIDCDLPSCSMTAGNIVSTKTTTVLWDHAELVSTHRRIHADVIIADITSGVASAQGHLAIETGDNRAVLQRWLAEKSRQAPQSQGNTP